MLDAPNPICGLPIVADLAAADEAAFRTEKFRILSECPYRIVKIDKALGIGSAESRRKGTRLGGNASTEAASVQANVKSAPTKNRRRRCLRHGARQSRRAQEPGDYTNAGGNFSHDAHR